MGFRNQIAVFEKSQSHLHRFRLLHDKRMRKGDNDGIVRPGQACFLNAHRQITLTVKQRIIQKSLVIRATGNDCKLEPRRRKLGFNLLPTATKLNATFPRDCLKNSSTVHQPSHPRPLIGWRNHDHSLDPWVTCVHTFWLADVVQIASHHDVPQTVSGKIDLVHLLTQTFNNILQRECMVVDSGSTAGILKVQSLIARIPQIVCQRLHTLMSAIQSMQQNDDLARVRLQLLQGG